MTQAREPSTYGTVRPLLRVLGLAFGLAMIVGGTVGVGILRSPGAVAAHLGSAKVMLAVWLLGGMYCLLAANNLSELATMTPKAGGPYVYARRAYGDYGGFVVGWSDWMFNTLALAFISIVFGEYASSLFPRFPGNVQVFGLGILFSLALFNWIGLRTGSAVQKLASVAKALALLGFVAACFAFDPPQERAIADLAPESVTAASVGTATGFVLAFQLVLGAYGGWGSAVYFAEEDRHPQRNLPRALFGGLLLVMGLYLLVNLALLQVLDVKAMASSTFAGGDAMRLMFGARSAQLVTALALLSIAGIINALLLFVPRILLALGRDGLFLRAAATVNAGGTPAFAMVSTSLVAAVLVVIGTFETLLAVSEFFAVTIVVLLNVALFVLRRREPDAARPFRAVGYPIVPAATLLVAAALFLAYISSNPRNSLYALVVLAATYPVFRAVRARDEKLRLAQATRGVDAG